LSFNHVFPHNCHGTHGLCGKIFHGQPGFSLRPLYTRNQSIMILGESDFSMTLAFSRKFGNCKSRVVGTSYMLKWGHGMAPGQWNQDQRKRQFLNEMDGFLDATLDECVNRGAIVRFGVDARDIQRTLMEPSRKAGMAVPNKFDRILFPFPRSSLRLFDAKEDPELIMGTLACCQHELADGGEIHIIMHMARNGLSQFDFWQLRDWVEDTGCVWRGCFPLDYRNFIYYQPKDVTGKPWRPATCMCHIFSPKGMKWQPYKTYAINTGPSASMRT